jgi:hypothetical protein
MRRWLLALVIVTLGSTVAQAQQAWAEKMFKDGTSHDFGVVARGAQLYHRFAITNIYAVPMQILDVKTSCGCTTATPSTKVLQSREVGYIDVVMDGKRFTGQKNIRINITVGPEFTSTAELKVTANSRADVVFNPGQVSFGIVSAGETPTQAIEVEYAGTLAWKAEGVDTNGAPYTVALEEWYRKPGQVGYRVRFTLKADAPAGALKHEVFLKTNDPTSKLVPLLVEATVQPTLTVGPDTLALKPGETKMVQVRSGKPFTIVRVDGLGEGLSVATPLPTKAATSHLLKINCETAKPGEVRYNVLIKTDAQELPAKLTIDTTGTP